MYKLKISKCYLAEEVFEDLLNDIKDNSEYYSEEEKKVMEILETKSKLNFNKMKEIQQFVGIIRNFDFHVQLDIEDENCFSIYIDTL